MFIFFSRNIAVTLITLHVTLQTGSILAYFLPSSPTFAPSLRHSPPTPLVCPQTYFLDFGVKMCYNISWQGKVRLHSLAFRLP